MTFVSEIRIFGDSKGGAFSGTINPTPGLFVFSAHNSYGKSLALKAVPWCLGLEQMFGLQNGDVSLFPEAVRTSIRLEGSEHEVISSYATIILVRNDGSRIQIVRPIVGANPEVVEVHEHAYNAERPPRLLRLNARNRTMSDATGGLQRYIFEWLGIPIQELLTRNGTSGCLYLENIAPLFFIDQIEGWSDLQAMQVRRYQLQEVEEASIEYLLGADEALKARVSMQAKIAKEARLKGEASAIKERIDALARSNGWTLDDWSSRGSPIDIATRWAKKKLSETLNHEFHFDFQKERARINAQISSHRNALAEAPTGTIALSAARTASQKVVELKALRHDVSQELRDARTKLMAQKELLQSIEHRKSASQDVHRIKTKGIGQMMIVSCPTCEQQVAPSALHLTERRREALEAHISTLSKQRDLVRSNISALESEILRLGHDAAVVENELAAAERGLETVTSVAGPERERLALVASELASAEREAADLARVRETVESIELEIQNWTQKVQADKEQETDGLDKLRRIAAFTNLLTARLKDLGHTALQGDASREVSLDDGYTPIFQGRRLRGLGSASDHPRLVAAYALALAQASASLELPGHHPGFVVLDEPQQQNPDQRHGEMLMHFLKSHALLTSFQTIVATSLVADDVNLLQSAGVSVRLLEGESFLQLQKASVDLLES